MSLYRKFQDVQNASGLKVYFFK